LNNTSRLRIQVAKAIWPPRLTQLCCLALAATIAANRSDAADVTFNIVGPSLTATDADEPRISDPLTSTSAATGFTYGDLWTDGGFVYLGTDRDHRGLTVHTISIAGQVDYVPGSEYQGNPSGDPNLEASQNEDVEVWGGYGYFGSDVTTGATGTGVDIVRLAVPFEPVFKVRINGANNGHNKVHTLSVYNNHLYTSDNSTDTIKVFNVSNPESPQYVTTIDLGHGIASHEVIVRNNFMYVASKTGSTGRIDIYDVSNPSSPQFRWQFISGAASHTATPSEDGKTLVIAEERFNGNVTIYDISKLGQPDQPATPPVLATINRTNLGATLPGKPTSIDGITPHHPHLYGNLLFVTWYEAGLQVFNISDRTTIPGQIRPVHVGAFDTFAGGPPEGLTTNCATSSTNRNCSGNWGVDLTLGLDTVLLSDRQRGVIVVNATDVLAKGDYDQDMTVDYDDHAAWRKGYGGAGTAQHSFAPFADGNYDGFVNASDYVVWKKFLGTSGPGGAGGGTSGINSPGVPEPSTLCLLMSGMALVCTLSRKRAA
jgi:hypothetical protein